MSESLQEAPRGLTGIAVRAGTAVAVMMGIENGLVLVRTLVLARLLQPRDFGLMGMAFVAMNLSEVLSQTGFSRAIVQRRGDPAPYLDTIWCVAALRGLALSAILFALSPLAAAFFRTPEVAPVLRVVAVSMILRGLVSPSWLLLERDLRFIRFALPRTLATGVDLLVTVCLAFALGSVWALVLGYLAGSLALLLLSFLVGPYAPRLRIDVTRARELYAFGKHVFRYELIAWVTDQADRLAVGRLRDASSLGLYSFAARLSSLPMQALNAVVLRVIFPTFSRIQTDPERVREAFVRLLGLLAVVVFPLAAGMLATAPELIPVLLGSNWVPMTDAFRALCVSGASSAVAITCATVSASIGRPDLATRSSLLKLAVLGAGLVPATALHGIAGAAAAMFLGSSASALYMVLSVSRAVGIEPRRSLSAFATPALSCAAMLAAVSAARAAASSSAPSLLLALLVTIGAAAYVAAVAGIDRLAGGGLVASVRGLFKPR